MLNNIRLSKNQIVLFKLILKVTKDKVKDFIISNFFRLKKWGKVNFFSTYKSLRSDLRQAPTAFYLSFWVFFHIWGADSLIVLVRILSCCTSALIMNYVKIYEFRSFEEAVRIFQKKRSCFSWWCTPSIHLTHTTSNLVERIEQHSY